MSDFKNVIKGGWHPKGKDGGKESWRGDFKGINQVAGWVGKGKGAGSNEENAHVARPLATLKDPSSFGPPPKNVNYHGGAALPNEITPHRGGLGAPLTQEQIESAKVSTASPDGQGQNGQSEKPAPPALPYRADRTGLRTDNLPPPPKHHDLEESSTVSTAQAPRPAPSLPPRLPARQSAATPPPPPSYETATNSSSVQPLTPNSNSFLNQSAVNRLGNAGISVPGLGIGKPSNNTANGATQKPTANLSELQSRFSRLNTTTTNNTANTPSSPTATTPTSPIATPQPQTPSWQQTRQALTTANSAYKDPSSVSLADAQNAAQTAQNAQRSAVAFRERHHETINAAQTRATQLNKRYNMTGRLNKFLEDANAAHDKQEQAAVQQPQTPTQGQSQVNGVTAQVQQPLQSPPPAAQQPHPQPVSSPAPQSATQELAASISRKPPPPPPPKKPASMQAPPPVPLGTKPSLG